MEPRKPNWDLWLAKRSAKAWECLALSVEVEPRDLSVDHFLVLRSFESGRPLTSEDDPDWLAEMGQRMQKLLKTLEDAPKGLRAGQGKAKSFDAQLKLDGFAKWARSKRMKLPRPLGAMLADEKDQASAKPASKVAGKKKSTAKVQRAGKSGN